MNVSVEVMSLEFSGETRQEAYKRAMSYYLKNIIGNKINNTSCDVKDGIEKHSARLTIYVTINMDDISEKHCSICRQISPQLYNSYHGNCSQCHAKGLRKRISDLLKERVEYVKTIIE